MITTKDEVTILMKMMINNGSLFDVLYSNAYQSMDLQSRKLNVTNQPPLWSFGTKAIPVLGKITFSVVFGKETMTCVEGQFLHCSIRFNVE